MNDIRRIILWVIFAFSLVMLWDHWQVHNGRAATFFPRATVTDSTSGETNRSDAAAPVSRDAAGHAVPDAVPSAASDGKAGGATTAGQAAPEGIAPAGERITVSSDVLELVFDSVGASIVGSKLLMYPDDKVSDRHVALFDTEGNHVYQAQTGLIGGAVPNHKTPMHFSGDRTLADGANELVLRFESDPVGDVRLVKTYTLKRGSYDVDVRHEIVNQSGQTISPQLYLQLVRDDEKVAGGTPFYSTFTGPAFYSDEKKYQKVSFKDIDKGKTKFVKDADDGYVAMVQHYFASAWILGDGIKRSNFARDIGNGLYAAGVIAPLGEIANGASHVTDSHLFAGPQIEQVLADTAPGLELVKDYGWVTILAKPLYWLLKHIHDVLGNWGWSIVGLVVLIKAAFYWLNAKAYGSMAKMKALNPRIQEMRARLKDKPQQMQMEMMRIYREEKVNPLGGCLPIAIQIPVFIALYWVLLSSVEMRGAPWTLWINDLSIKDPYFILPVLMTLTTLLQTALNPAPPDPMQAKLMWIMPLGFSVMFFLFPAGLVLYWITNNLLSITQQYIINRRMGVDVKFRLPPFLTGKKAEGG